MSSIPDLSVADPATGPLVSVVTPVHNGATFLEECIDSVLAQTYSNWEYAIVDNASTDATPEIIARFSSRDSRIRHLRFDTLVDATENHNRAFRTIAPESEFCKVVQADDWIYPECLERMVAVSRRSEKIGIISSYRLWGDRVDLVGFPYEDTVISGKCVLRQALLGGPYVTGAPTALLYRSRVIRAHDPFYSQRFEHSDTEAAYRVLSRWDFGYVHQVLTFARRQRGARMEWASRMSTYAPENIRFLLRYGPAVLEPERYRRQLRLELWRYLWFQAKQVPKPSRFRDGRYFAVHLDEIEGILEEGADDPEVRAAMAVVKAMLLRGRGRRKGETTIR